MSADDVAATHVDRRRSHRDHPGISDMFELIAILGLVALMAVGSLSIRPSTDVADDPVEPSLWPYLHY
jgi:hypothetical protein